MLGYDVISAIATTKYSRTEKLQYFCLNMNMFQLPSVNIQGMLQHQTNQFLMCLGAGDFQYQSLDLKSGQHKWKDSVVKKTSHRGINTPTSTRQAYCDNSIPTKRTVDDIFNTYKLKNTSGPQWTSWRENRACKQMQEENFILPPSPAEPHAELFIDIHEERMEGLSYTFEETNMSLT